MGLAGLAEKFGAAFGIRKGEFIRTFSLFLYLLFVIASYTAARTVRDSLYLTKFGALKLPYVYIGIAVLVGIFVSIYIKIAKRTKQNLLLSLTLIFFISNLTLFWWLFKFQPAWLYPVIYIWVGIFGVIAPMQVWTLSNFILTTREAKRLYGFIGSGGILGAIAGGFYSSWMVPLIGTENLLLSIAGFLVICVLLVNIIWFKSAKSSEEAINENSEGQNEYPSNLRESLNLITQSRYLILIASIISIASIVTTIIDYQFKAVVQSSVSTKDQLTVFFGNFYGYLGSAAFLLQIFLTSKLMKRLGIGFTIFLLPVSLFLGSVALLAYMTIWSAALLKGPDQFFKHSIDRSTIELLYLPVPTEIKAAVKPFIDTIVWRMADGTAGIILLFLTSIISLTIREISMVNIFFLTLWIALAYVTKKEYVEALRSAIYRKKSVFEKLQIETEAPSKAGNFTTPAVSSNTNDILRVLDLIDFVKEKKGLVPNQEKPTGRNTPEVREKITNYGKEYYATLMLLQAYSPNGQGQNSNHKKRDLLQDFLEEKMEILLERIFRLLGLIYSPDDLYHSYYGIFSENIRIRANALELLDNLLESDHKKLVLPIIDEEIQLSKKLEVGESLGLVRYANKEEALTKLFKARDPLIVLCAIDSVHTQQLEALYEQIEKATKHSDPLVSDAAEKVWSLIQTRRLQLCSQPNLQEIRKPRKTAESRDLTALEKIKYLQKALLFAHCKMDQLLDIASIAHKVAFKKGEVIFRENDPGDSLYCIVVGRVLLKKERTAFKTIIGEREAFGTLAILDRRPRSATALAEEDIVVLRISSEDFYDLLANRIEIVQGIFSRLTEEIRNYMDTGELESKGRDRLFLIHSSQKPKEQKRVANG